MGGHAWEWVVGYQGHGGVAGGAGVTVAAAGTVMAATLAGGYVALRRPRWWATAFALAAGFLLATVVIHIVPDLDGIGPLEGGASAAAALATYATLTWAHRAHRRGHAANPPTSSPANPPTRPPPHAPSAHQTLGWIGAAGFLLHRAVEGLALGTGLLIDGGVALAVLVAIVVHSAGEGAALVAYLISLGARRRSAAGWLAATAVMPALGAVTVTRFTLSEDVTHILLAALAGLFVFVAQTIISSALRSAARGHVLALAGMGAAVLTLIGTLP
ncbi:MAG: hypothetical protein GEV03_25780 [Streptosporangiales bacterium]|nr:hypothetical protein [Streptosporangiales bacterium]